jgi:hypothetical protein
MRVLLLNPKFRVLNQVRKIFLFGFKNKKDKSKINRFSYVLNLKIMAYNVPVFLILDFCMPDYNEQNDNQKTG